MPTRVLKYSTPLQCYKKCFPFSRMHSDLPLKVFSCTVFVRIPNNTQSKLDPTAEKCVYIWYASNKKGYKCYNPQTRKIYVSMHVSFFENKSYFHKTSLQGENEVMEEIFLDLSPSPLPKVILTTISHSSLPTISNLQSQEQCENSEGSSGNIISNITVS